MKLGKLLSRSIELMDAVQSRVEDYCLSEL